MAVAVSTDRAVAQAPEPAAISGNPADTNFGIVGTGWFGRQLGLKDEWGVKFGGVWLADSNVIAAGGAQPDSRTNNQAFILGLGLDAEKLAQWRGASSGFQFLLFNGSDTNGQAGSVQDGTGGFYAFGSQRVACHVNSGVKNSSVSIFHQVGANNSQTIPMTQYYGVGITGFGLIGSHQSDSMGMAAGLTRLNPNLFERQYELMFHAYYQANLFATTFLQPTITYIPTPAASPTLPGALTTTLRLTVFF